MIDINAFLNNFWANFIAGFCLAGLFSIAFVHLFEYYRKPKLKLIWHKKFNHDFNWISINIRNNGKTALKEREINWHLYIPHVLDFDFLEGDKYKTQFAGSSPILNEEYDHYREFNFFPSFPEREIVILKLKLNDVQGNKFRIYYHFSSVVGIQPRRVWRKFWYRRIAERNGEVRLGFLPYIEIGKS